MKLCDYLYPSRMRFPELLQLGDVSRLPVASDVNMLSPSGIYNLQQSSHQAEDALSQGMEALQQSLAETLANGSPATEGSSGDVANYMGQMAMAMGKLGTLEGFLRQLLEHVASKSCSGGLCNCNQHALPTESSEYFLFVLVFGEKVWILCPLLCPLTRS
ncbi:hypothetical protein RDI58_025600 [Solanum bulbocastanum]|uniref:Uncharacterized protein n=1 Tax=Solanum bulbocastanum TaxID=147425 RepID=A0AAN8T4G6_SOLBU